MLLFALTIGLPGNLTFVVLTQKINNFMLGTLMLCWWGSEIQFGVIPFKIFGESLNPNNCVKYINIEINNIIYMYIDNIFENQAI